MIRFAREEDREAIMSLYRSMIGTEGCTWDDNYPSDECFSKDLEGNDIICMEEDGIIVSALSFDKDEDVAGLDVWTKELEPSKEFSRMVVREQYQNRGIARQMLTEGMRILRERGYRSTHYLVSPGNKKALNSYIKLGFNKVGEREYAGHDWLCYEKEL